MTIPLKIVDNATVTRIVGRSFEWMRGSSISKLWISLAIVWMNGMFSAMDVPSPLLNELYAVINSCATTVLMIKSFTISPAVLPTKSGRNTVPNVQASKREILVKHFIIKNHSYIWYNGSRYSNLYILPSRRLMKTAKTDGINCWKRKLYQSASLLWVPLVENLIFDWANEKVSACARKVSNHYPLLSMES